MKESSNVRGNGMFAEYSVNREREGLQCDPPLGSTHCQRPELFTAAVLLGMCCNNTLETTSSSPVCMYGKRHTTPLYIYSSHNRSLLVPQNDTRHATIRKTRSIE